MLLLEKSVSLLVHTWRCEGMHSKLLTIVTSLWQVDVISAAFKYESCF